MRLNWLGLGVAVGSLGGCSPTPLTDTGSGSGAEGTTGSESATTGGSSETGAPGCGTVQGYAINLAGEVCRTFQQCEPELFVDQFGNMAGCMEQNSDAFVAQGESCEFDAAFACECVGLARQISGMCEPSAALEEQLNVACGSVFDECVADTGKLDWGDGDGDKGDAWGDGDGDGDCAALPPGGPAQLGDACFANSDCGSNLCLSFDDAPPDPNAICEVPPASCRTRITATVADLETGAPLPNASVVVAGAIAASVNPTNVTNPEAIASSDAAGRIDTTTGQRIEQPLGIVALAESPMHFLTASTIAAPVSMNFYGPGIDRHEVWVVRRATLDAWSNALAVDAALSGFLPLGDEGGVVALIRDDLTGAPLSGYTLASTDAGSSAVIRYHAPGGSFDGAETDATGIVIIFDPGLGEDFAAFTAGGMPTGVEQAAGSTPQVIHTMVFDL